MSFVRDLLTQAADTIDQRAADRDVAQERSMAATVAVFNAMFGTTLTETQGWRFMQILKMVRGNRNGYRADDHIDEAAYAALAAEAKQAAWNDQVAHDVVNDMQASLAPATATLNQPQNGPALVLDQAKFIGQTSPVSRTVAPDISSITALDAVGASLATGVGKATAPVTSVPDLSTVKPDIGKGLENAVSAAVNKDAALWTGTDKGDSKSTGPGKNA